MCIRDRTYTEGELLQLAGKLAIACRMLLTREVGSSGEDIVYMKQCLDEYDNAVFSSLKNDNVVIGYLPKDRFDK